MDAAELPAFQHNGVTSAGAKYAAALILSHLRRIKNNAANVALNGGGRDWLAGGDANVATINADIVAAIDANSLAYLERCANAGVATADEQMA